MTPTRIRAAMLALAFLIGVAVLLPLAWWVKFARPVP